MTPWTVVHQALLFMGFPRQEYWSGLPFPIPEDLPHPGIKPTSPASPASAGEFFTAEPSRKPPLTLAISCQMSYITGEKKTFSKIYISPHFFMFIFVHVKNSFKYQMWASLVVQLVKNLPAMWETWVQSLDWEDALEEGMATHSSFLAWRIPRTEEPGGLQSMESQRVEHV